MKDEIPELVRFTSHGVKCDTPGCDYTTSEDLTCPEDYALYVDKPCPKCGASLLTFEDFRALQMTQPLLDMMNAIAADSMTDEQLADVLKTEPTILHGTSDGKGGVDLGIVNFRVTRDE